jgi:hypothetical protein
MDWKPFNFITIQGRKQQKGDQIVMKPCQSQINQSTQKQKGGRGEKTRNKMEGLTSKKTKEPPKKVLR